MKKPLFVQSVIVICVWLYKVSFLLPSPSHPLIFALKPRKIAFPSQWNLHHSVKGRRLHCERAPITLWKGADYTVKGRKLHDKTAKNGPKEPFLATSAQPKIHNSLIVIHFQKTPIFRLYAPHFLFGDFRTRNEPLAEIKV